MRKRRMALKTISLPRNREIWTYVRPSIRGLKTVWINECKEWVHLWPANRHAIFRVATGIEVAKK
jgi:hypothetical protein